jgi:hypothetical protein
MAPESLDTLVSELLASGPAVTTSPEVDPSKEPAPKVCSVLRVPTIHLFQRAEFRPRRLDHLPTYQELQKCPSDLMLWFVREFNAHPWAAERGRWSVATHQGVVHLVGIKGDLRPAAPNLYPFVVESGLSMPDALAMSRAENEVILRCAHAPRIWCIAAADPSFPPIGWF